MPGTPAQSVIGRTLGSYKVVEQIGSGGMGVVFRAVHPLLGKKAAVKLLLPQFTEDQAVVSRFFHEARASALIGHPGIVDVFDFGMTEDGSAYLVMEMLEGEGLGARLKREKRLPPPLALAITRQVTSAVGAAHDAGIIHRDLKPDNLFLVPDRDAPLGIRVKVLDFGVAKLARDLQGVTMNTTSGIALGTPYYMSPEQCCNAAGVDRHTDIYSLGCILFEMLTGRTPFQKTSYAAMVAAHIHESPPLPSTIVTGLPRGMNELVLRTLAKEPEQRHGSMVELGRDLDAVASGVATGASPRVETAPHPKVAERLPSSPGEEERPSGRRLWLGLLVAILAAAGVALPVLYVLDKEDVPTAEAPPVAAQAEAEAVPPEVPPPVVMPVTSPDEERPKTVKLEVRSTPRAAEVYRAVDGIRLGVTPLPLEVSTTKGDLVLIVKKDGFEPKTIHLPADRDNRADVKLEKLPVKKKGGKKGVKDVDDDGALDPFETKKQR